MTQPFARVFVCIGVIWALVHDLDFHFTDANAGRCMIWNVKVARERAQLLELELVDNRVLPVRHGEFKLAVLPTAEVLDRPDDLALTYVEVGPIWVLLWLLGSHHGLRAVDVAVGVNDGRLDACDVLPRCDNRSTSALLVLLVHEDA